MRLREIIREAAGEFDWSRSGGSRDVVIGQSTICYGVGSNPEFPKQDYAEIISLRTKTKALGTGSARRAMEALCRSADEHGITLRLAASPLTKKTNLGRLVRFYQSFGFELTGKTINLAGDPYLQRSPRSPGSHQAASPS